MDIKKRNRAELKSYFVKNAIPTENNFADLIDATIVQASDGVAKPAGEPLSVEAIGDPTSRKQVLSLYNAFSDNAPAFTVELNPRSDPNNAATAKPGLSFSTSAGASRLFIDAASGNVGVGTNAPNHPLHVRAGEAVGLYESTDAQAYLRISTREGINNRVEVANRPGGRLALWTAGGSDSLNILRDGRVGVGRIDPHRMLHVGRGGQLSLMQDSVTNNSEAGIYWHTGPEYAIRRSVGNWDAPGFQQLVVDWPTGIVMRPGTGNNAGYEKSYVEIAGGKGLRVSEGALVVGATDPGPSKLRIVNSPTDQLNVHFAAAGAGDLHFTGWGGGWNITSQTDGKHLHLNRDAGPASNLFLGRGGLELRVYGDGRVSVAGDPVGNNKLSVRGDAHLDGLLVALGGVHFAGNVGAHVEADGVLYRYGGQAYVTVDDNLYFRQVGSDIKFHFDLINGVLRQDPWQDAPLTQSWVNYQGGYHNAGFYRDRSGRVHLRGLVRSGTVGWNATIFVLPAGYRPAARELRAVCTNDNTIGRVDIETDGRVIPASVNNGWVSLDGISFRVI